MLKYELQSVVCLKIETPTYFLDQNSNICFDVGSGLYRVRFGLGNSKTDSGANMTEPRALKTVPLASKATSVTLNIIQSWVILLRLFGHALTPN